jgi:hypothetical protein
VVVVDSVVAVSPAAVGLTVGAGSTVVEDLLAGGVLTAAADSTVAVVGSMAVAAGSIAAAAAVGSTAAAVADSTVVVVTAAADIASPQDPLLSDKLLTAGRTTLPAFFVCIPPTSAIVKMFDAMLVSQHS